ncbi:fucose mutarotase-like isoform X1 [Octopus vulgaris]|uniref:L-fucose mutarotase n=1 Tax=Octopus vulgaris TaxID=6645 RepID=A0AA36BFE5_OCTVU|nr:fucose mutarotase-like isoform X1 [Octopus vulgaris]
MPLKGIPSIISPALLHALAAMGHGDEIVLADAHFPTSSICRRGPIEIRADGHKIPELLKAILQLFPLDTYEDSVFVMKKTDEDKNLLLPHLAEYEKILSEAENKCMKMIEVERFAFYEQAKRAYAIVHTGELAKYGNIILKKGLAL